MIKMTQFLNIIYFISAVSFTISKVILPYVPDTVYPPVPTKARLDPEVLQLLQNDDQDPEVWPGLFQGDMAMDDELYDYWRVGIRWDIYPERRWPSGVVPYVVSPLYEPRDRATILKAIKILNVMTCVRFEPWNGKREDFLLIWPVKYPAGCWSYVGRTGGVQLLSLMPPNERGNNCLGDESRAIHELMHALGIFHEQSRSDRDRFVTVHFDNIIKQYAGNFIKQSLNDTRYYFEYDYDSIMHYGSTYFAKRRGLKTITSKRPGLKIGQREKMSKTDCLKINELYGCLEDPILAKKYYALCQALGL